MNPYVHALVAVSGFRMPVFFVFGRLFSAMSWRSRGLRHLVMQRLERIVLSMLAAMFTIVPMTAGIATGSGFTPLDRPGDVAGRSASSPVPVIPVGATVR